MITLGQWAVWDPLEQCLNFHYTEEEALVDARDILSDCLDDDGTWDDYTIELCVLRIAHRIELNVKSGYDYKIVKVEEPTGGENDSVSED